MHGAPRASWEGLLPQLWRRMQATESEAMQAYYQKYVSDKPCEACGASRLKPESRAVRVDGVSLDALAKMTVGRAHAFLSSMRLGEADAQVASELLRETLARLGFLLDVGLDYLTLERASGSLSGGESQRIRLASQIGSELTGVIYVLDEPSIGLHPRDNGRLLATLERLRDVGNSLIVVEHDEETIRAADWVVDFGPGAGELGGEVVAEGRPDAIERSERSLTGSTYRESARSPFRRCDARAMATRSLFMTRGSIT